MPASVSFVTWQYTSVAPPGAPGAMLRSTGGWMIAWFTNGTRSWLARYHVRAFAWYGA